MLVATFNSDGVGRNFRTSSSGIDHGRTASHRMTAHGARPPGHCRHPHARGLRWRKRGAQQSVRAAAAGDPAAADPAGQRDHPLPRFTGNADRLRGRRALPRVHVRPGRAARRIERERRHHRAGGESRHGDDHRRPSRCRTPRERCPRRWASTSCRRRCFPATSPSPPIRIRRATAPTATSVPAEPAPRRSGSRAPAASASRAGPSSSTSCRASSRSCRPIRRSRWCRR